LINITLLVATVGSGMGSQLGAARLLYGMGRSNALPKSFFGAIEPKRRIPQNNVLFVGVLALAGTAVLNFERAAELLNFGALLAFMGVNAASFTRYFLRERKKTATNFLVPVLGFLICLLLWLNLSRPAKIAGVIWMFLGIAYGAWRTKGFRAELVNFDVPGEAAQ
jgi:amino acid transporter